ncbi:MAG: hypothetical protein RQ736_02880 [Thiogranum sp.]|nr:hypothetical protein [Thiogranum sp.]
MGALTHLTLLASVWILYAAIHSILASGTCKTWFQRHFPKGFRAYRLTFNLGSILLLIPPLWLLLAYPGEPLWQWPDVAGWLLNIAALAAVAGFFTTLGSYDMAEFIGTRQLADRRTSVNDQAPMGLSWAHRFVRHPWYFFGLVIIWTREMNAALLLSAVILTLYLVVGSRLEEKKLVLLYGDTYRRYMQRVPGLIPRPWRYLRRSQVQEILASKKPLSPQ